MDNQDRLYKANILIFLWRCLYYAVPGFALGVIIQNGFTDLYNKYSKNKGLVAFFHIAVKIICLYIIVILLPQKYVDEWLDTLPGVFFLNFYFLAGYKAYTSFLR